MWERNWVCERDLEGRSKEENLSTSKRSLKKVFQDKCKLFQNRWKFILIIFSFILLCLIFVREKIQKNSPKTKLGVLFYELLWKKFQKNMEGNIYLGIFGRGNFWKIEENYENFS